MQQPRDHQLHLFLVGCSVTGDGELHLVWAVLLHRDTGPSRSNERKTVGLPDRDGGARVVLEKDPLDGHCSRGQFPDEVLDLSCQLGETLREWIGGRCADDAVTHGLDVWALATNRAVPTARHTRVDAQNGAARIEHEFVL